MNWIFVLLLDVVLAFVLLFSVQIAAGFGELCGKRPGSDKSGLGGFVALLLFMLFRWLAVAALVLGLANGDAVLGLLAIHAALGVATYRTFHVGLERVQRDRWAPQWLGLLGAVVLPLPAVTWSFVHINAPWCGSGAATWIGAALGSALMHAACYRSRRRDMLRVHS